MANSTPTPEDDPAPPSQETPLPSDVNNDDMNTTPETHTVTTGPEAPDPSNKEKAVEWLNQIFLNHKFVATGDANIYVKDLLNITLQRGSNSYITGEVLSVALDLFTREHNHTEDVLVLSDDMMQVLCPLGKGQETVEATRSLLPNLYEKILNKSIRWIVAPCSDGVHGVEAFNKRYELENIQKKKMLVDQAQGQSKGPNSETSTPQAAPKESPKNRHGIEWTGMGLHWGLLIVDKTEKVAHWVDSLLTLERSGKKEKIAHMYHAGTVAGKALAGIDAILATEDGFEKGSFDASTLKFVPHQRFDNDTAADDGACGSFIVAFLRHLYNHPMKMERLKAAFPGSKRRSLRFSSADMRREISDAIRKEGETREELPFKLTVELLHALNAISDGYLRELVDVILGKKSIPSPKSGREGGKNKGGGSDDSDDGDGDGDHRDFEKKALRRFIIANPDQFQNAGTWAEKYDLAIALLDSQKNGGDTRNDADKTNPHSRNWEPQVPINSRKKQLPDFARLLDGPLKQWMDISKELFTSRPGIKFHNDTFRAVLHRTYKGTFKDEPQNSLIQYNEDTNAFADVQDFHLMKSSDIAAELDATYLTLDLPATFGALSDDEVDHWVSRLPPAAYDLVTEPERKGMPRRILYLRARGLLHRMFVGELDEMSPEQMKAWREADNCIDADYRMTNEAAMVIMKILYGQQDVRVPWLLRSPLHWPARKNRKIRITSGEKRKHNEDYIDKSDDESRPNKRPKTAGGPSQPHSGEEPRTTGSNFLANDDEAMEGADGTAVPRLDDWRTMTDANLEKYITAEVRRDGRIGKQANKYSFRAVLFVNHGGTFKAGSTEKGNEMAWIRDTNVFRHGTQGQSDNLDLVVGVDGEVRVIVEQREVLQRMAARYEAGESSDSETPLRNQGQVQGKKKPPPGKKGPKTGGKGGPNGSKPALAGPSGTGKSKPRSEGKPQGGKPPSAGPSDPRESAAGTGGSKAVDAEGLYSHTPDFSAAPSSYIHAWIDKHPDPDLRKSRTTMSVKRRVLQQDFGGFDGLSDESLKHWYKHDPKSFKEMRKSFPDFDRRRVLDELKKPVVKSEDKYHIKQFYKVRDLQGHREYYPQAYIDHYNRIYASKPAEMTTAQPVTDTAPASNSGRNTRASSRNGTTPPANGVSPRTEVVSPVTGAADLTKKKSSSPKEKTSPSNQAEPSGTYLGGPSDSDQEALSSPPESEDEDAMNTD